MPKIAREYCRSSPPISEAISAGNVGLMQAVARFQPEKGFRFGTYAAWWIRGGLAKEWVEAAKSAAD